MKLFNSVLLSFFLIVWAPIVTANQWYIGATQAIYDLGEDSERNGNIEVGQLGLQLGNNLNDRFINDGAIGAVFVSGQNQLHS